MFNIHSFIHTIFCVLLGCVSVGQCAFLFLGINIQVVNCFLEDSGGPEKGLVGSTCTVEVERVKMTMVCPSADTEAHCE